jgi:hypothetical protein
MPESELMRFWSRFSHPKRKDAALLIGDTRPGYTGLAKLLSGYAANKATAITCRLRGDIQAAGIYETICENIYAEIPTDLRW